MNAHTKQQDKVFETDFIDSPPCYVHHLAPSNMLTSPCDTTGALLIVLSIFVHSHVRLEDYALLYIITFSSKGGKGWGRGVEPINSPPPQ